MGDGRRSRSAPSLTVCSHAVLGMMRVTQGVHGARAGSSIQFAAHIADRWMVMQKAR